MITYLTPLAEGQTFPQGVLEGIARQTLRGPHIVRSTIPDTWAQVNDNIAKSWRAVQTAAPREGIVCLIDSDVEILVPDTVERAVALLATHKVVAIDTRGLDWSQPTPEGLNHIDCALCVMRAQDFHRVDYLGPFPCACWRISTALGTPHKIRDAGLARQVPRPNIQDRGEA